MREHTHTHESDLEDTMTMSAGRCWPLVTFTMSPTATWWPDAAVQQRERKEVERRRRRGVKGKVRGHGRGKGGERKQEAGYLVTNLEAANRERGSLGSTAVRSFNSFD